MSCLSLCDAQLKIVSIGKVSNKSSAILDVASSDYDKTGSGATAIATLDSNGVVTAVAATNGGNGYVAPAQVSIFGTDDSFDAAQSARATATVVNGAIASITVTNGGTGYVSGKTSVSINSANKAVVLPRVDLVSTLNGTTPINNPKDGLHVCNNATNIDSGIYFWNSHATPDPKWKEEFLF